MQLLQLRLQTPQPAPHGHPFTLTLTLSHRGRGEMIPPLHPQWRENAPPATNTSAITYPSTTNNPLSPPWERARVRGIGAAKGRGP